MGTSAAVCASIYLYGLFIAVLVSLFRPDVEQLSPIMAHIVRLVLEHLSLHVVVLPDVFLIGTGLPLLMVLELDVASNAFLFQEQKVPLAAVAAVGSDLAHMPPKCLLMLLQHWDQGAVVRPVAADMAVDDEVVLYGYLYVVCRFQLAVEHMILFHPHEGGLHIRLGVAVAAFPHDLEAFLVFHQPLPALLQLFVELLQLRLALPSARHERDPLALRNLRQPGLELEYLQRRAGIDLYHGVIGCFLMPRQLPGTVLPYHLPNLVHPFDDEHLGVSEAVLLTVSVLRKELVVFLV